MEDRICDWKARLTQVRAEMAAEARDFKLDAADWGSLLSAEYSLEEAIGELQQIIGESQTND